MKAEQVERVAENTWASLPAVPAGVDRHRKVGLGKLSFSSPL